jgi:hypothetical protein
LFDNEPEEVLRHRFGWYMNYKNKILSLLAKKIVERNKRFKDLHEGESCYLIGNGSSLKYFDLKKFGNKIAIGCNSLFYHRDFKEINVKYYYQGHSFCFYPYWRNTTSTKIEKNMMVGIDRAKILLSNGTSYFFNLSNCFGIRGDNVFYVHHFGEPFDNFSNCNLNSNFTLAGSGLGGMLGLAIYMGFKDITLVGCDYTFLPQPQMHFYEFGGPPVVFPEKPYHEKILLAAAEKAVVRTVTPNETFRGSSLSHISYQELTGDEPRYKENHEIVSQPDLLALDAIGWDHEIFP